MSLSDISSLCPIATVGSGMGVMVSCPYTEEKAVLGFMKNKDVTSKNKERVPYFRMFQLCSCFVGLQPFGLVSTHQNQTQHTKETGCKYKIFHSVSSGCWRKNWNDRAQTFRRNSGKNCCSSASREAKWVGRLNGEVFRACPVGRRHRFRGLGTPQRLLGRAGWSRQGERSLGFPAENTIPVTRTAVKEDKDAIESCRHKGMEIFLCAPSNRGLQTIMCNIVDC